MKFFVKFVLRFEISDVKYLVKFGVRLFDLPGKHQNIEFWGELRQNFRKLRFNFRVFFLKLRSAEGRC